MSSEFDLSRIHNAQQAYDHLKRTLETYHASVDGGPRHAPIRFSQVEREKAAAVATGLLHHLKGAQREEFVQKVLGNDGYSDLFSKVLFPKGPGRHDIWAVEADRINSLKDAFIEQGEAAGVKIRPYRSPSGKPTSGPPQYVWSKH